MLEITDIVVDLTFDVEHVTVRRMSKLTICVGLPGSGKSSWAEEQVKNGDGKVVRVNRDDLRVMLHANIWSGGREKATVAVRDAAIEAALKAGFDVICDDTNLDPRVQGDLTRIAIGCGAEHATKSFTDVPLKTCIKRDAARSRTVGRKVIVDMYYRWLRPKPDPVLQDNYARMNLPHAIIVDMDGTLAHVGKRSPYDDHLCEVDVVNENVDYVTNLIKNHGNAEMKMIIVSGRDEGRSREATERWLKANDINYDMLIMRKAGDTRPDDIVKSELYWEHIAGQYWVRCVFDDRDSVVDMWRRELGLTVMQVNFGDF